MVSRCAWGNTDFAAMDSGDQTTLMTTNAAAVDACGLLMRDLGFAIRGPGLEFPIYVNDTFDWRRTSSSHAEHRRIEDLWLDYRESGLTSGNALFLGADGEPNAAARGSLVLRNLRLHGPESVNPASAVSPETSLVGLRIEFAINGTEDNVGANRFFHGTHRVFCFPWQSNHVQFGENFTGMYMSSATNNSTFINAQAQECWFSFVIRYTNNRIANQTWIQPRSEGSKVAVVIDCQSLTGGVDRMRDISFIDPWFTGTEYDIMRVCRSWDETDPSDRGDGNSDRIIGLHIKGGNWTPEGGAWSATQAAILAPPLGGGGNSSLRGINAELPVEDVSNATPGQFTGGAIRFIGTPHTTTGTVNYQDKMIRFDGSGSRTTVWS